MHLINLLQILQIIYCLQSARDYKHLTLKRYDCEFYGEWLPEEWHRILFPAGTTLIGPYHCKISETLRAG